MIDPDRTRLFSWASVREGVIVVLSILIAFALDASWDRWNVDRDFLEQLEDVRAEIELSRDEFEFGLDHHLWAAEASALIAARLGSGGGASVPVADTLVRALFQTLVSDIDASTIQDFVSAGGLQVVDDPELKRTLRRWPAWMVDTQDDQGNLRAFVNREMAPYMRSEFTLASVMPLPAQDSVRTGSVELRPTDPLLNYLAYREYLDRSIARLMEDQIRMTDRMLEQLDEILR